MVCIDFTIAHAGLLFNSRAHKIRQRFVIGIDYRAATSIGAPNVHADLEVYLGTRWYLLAAHSSEAISTTARPRLFAASC